MPETDLRKQQQLEAAALGALVARVEALERDGLAASGNLRQVAEDSREALRTVGSRSALQAAIDQALRRGGEGDGCRVLGAFVRAAQFLERLSRCRAGARVDVEEVVAALEAARADDEIGGFFGEVSRRELAEAAARLFDEPPASVRTALDALAQSGTMYGAE